MPERYREAPSASPDDRLPGGQRQCAHTSKRSGKRCCKPAMIGCRGCRSHGGPSENKPCEANIKHGLKSPYIREDRVPYIVELAEQLKTSDGQKDFIAFKAARKADLKANIDPAADLESFMRVDDAERSDVAMLAKLEEQARDAATPQTGNVSYVVGLQGGPTIVRGPAGTPVSALDDPDAPGRYLLKCDDGAWRPAQEFECAPGITAYRPIINAVLSDGE